MRTTPARAAAPSPQSAAALRAGRTASFLYALGGLYMYATGSQLPPGASDRIWVPAAVAAATALVVLAVPWGRLPPWTSLLPPLWAFVVLLWPLGVHAQALSHYLLLYTLLFLYVGLTQRRGTALLMLPLALLSLLPVRSEATLLPPLFLVGPVVVAVLLAELLAFLLAQQRRSQAHLVELLEATADLQAAATTRDAADVIARLCHSLLGADSVVVMLREEPGSTRLVNVDSLHAAAAPGQLRLDLARTGSGASAALATGTVLFSSDAATDPRLDQGLVGLVGAASAVFIPLGAHGAFEGVAVAVFTRHRRSIDLSAQHAAEVLATQAGQVLRRVRESVALRDLASTDALTGLLNRRVLFTRLTALRPGDSLVFLDLDHFKSINDSRGHQAGDAVLRSFGAALHETMRSGDTCARYGGEGCALLLPQTPAADAAALVDRLRQRWVVEVPGVTFSAGIAVHGQRSPTETLAAADAAVYEAKRGGRDTTRVAHDGLADIIPLERRRQSAG